jgi:long-subunit acyl-CoA synthetase (AMP-forming)
LGKYKHLQKIQDETKSRILEWENFVIKNNMISVFIETKMESYLNDFKKNCPKSISAYTMSEVEKIGAESEEFTDYKIPQKDDLAIIMYTSGSTGY